MVKICGNISLRPGIPQEVLPVYASEHNADLVIVGAWRQSKMENLLIGSTTKAMLRRAACDVLVLPFTETCNTQRQGKSDV